MDDAASAGITSGYILFTKGKMMFLPQWELQADTLLFTTMGITSGYTLIHHIVNRKRIYFNSPQWELQADTLLFTTMGIVSGYTFRSPRTLINAIYLCPWYLYKLIKI